MKTKYRLISSETVEDLIENINELAEMGYELDKLTTSGTPSNDWQGIAIMKLSNIVDENLIISQYKNIQS